MDDINNNTGIGDTQNTNPTQSANDYNSMQPVTDLVDNLSGMPAAKDENKPVEEFPNQATSNPIVEDTTPSLDAVQPVVQSPIPDLGVFNTNTIQTPMMETSEPVQPTEVSPSMDTTTSIPSFDSTTPEVTPTETQAPYMEAPVEMPSLDTSLPEEIPNSFSSTESPSVSSIDSVLPSQDLSQPLEQFSAPIETPMPAFQDTEVVNTLTDEKGEKGKGSTAVVIVLIVVIVALLITIGYFAYKIFFA